MSGIQSTCCTTAVGSTTNAQIRPKSKKELRAEKKAAKKAAAATTTVASKPKPSLTPEEIKKEQIKEEKIRLKKERRKEQLKEREKEGRQGKKEKKKREFEEQIQHFLESGWEKPPGKKRRRIDRASKEEDASDKVSNAVGEEEDTKPVFQTLKMGVKFVDIIVGEGPEIVKDNSLLTVRYKLTGGKYGVLIDSSKKFTFRVGKGEVVKGWDIGVLGMAVGGMRKLIVPPKAGYGGEDIGAGHGGLLFFDISVISCT
ncbi:hypothetical protein ACHAXR_009362 [Thalassiosira sp. AJA248-18]